MAKLKNIFKFHKSTTDISEWNKNDEKLLKAVECSDEKRVVSILHKKTILTTKLGPEGFSVFHIACAQGHLQIIEHLLAYGTNVNATTIKENTALQLASHNGWPKVVERLLQAGAQVDCHDVNKMTALHQACANTQAGTVEVLLQYKANVDATDKTGKSSLFYCSHLGSLEICKMLVNKGSDVNFKDYSNLTPLIVASKRGHKDICKFLLQQGANPNLKDHRGYSAQKYAIQSGHNELLELFDKTSTQASCHLEHSDPAAENKSAELSQIEVSQEEYVDKFMLEESSKLEQENQIHSKLEAKDQTLNQAIKNELDAVGTFQPNKQPTPIMQEAVQMVTTSPDIVNQKLQDSYDELLEEQKSLHKDVQKLTVQNMTLKQQLNTLQSQGKQSEQMENFGKIQRLDDEIRNLKNLLAEEKQKNLLLEGEKLSVNNERSLERKNEADDDSWEDGNEVVFVTPAKKLNIETVLKSKIMELEEENSQLKEFLQALPNGIRDPTEMQGVARNKKISLERVGSTELEDSQNEVKRSREKETLLQQSSVSGQERDLLHENAQLQDMVASLNKELEEMKQQFLMADPQKTEKSQQNMLEKENNRADYEQLNQEHSKLKKEYADLVQAGDNLQDEFDQLQEDKEKLHEDFDKLSAQKELVIKENSYLITEGESLQRDMEKVLNQLEELKGRYVHLQKESEEQERRLGKSSEMMRLQKEKDQLEQKCEELESNLSCLKHDHDIIIEEVQSMQEKYSSVCQERVNLRQEHHALQQEFGQLEQDYADLLEDKEKLEEAFMALQTANAHFPESSEERQKLLTENTLLVESKEEVEMQCAKLTKKNSQLEQEIEEVKYQFKEVQDKLRHEGDKVLSVSSDTSIDKDHKIRSLQIQISRLQQQITESEKRHKNIVQSYRTHLLSAVQDHMDPDVRQALYSIIELRSLEQFC